MGTGYTEQPSTYSLTRLNVYLKRDHKNPPHCTWGSHWRILSCNNLISNLWLKHLPLRGPSMRWGQDTCSAFVHLNILCVQFCAQVFHWGDSTHERRYGELKVVQILNLNDQTDVHWWFRQQVTYWRRHRFMHSAHTIRTSVTVSVCICNCTASQGCEHSKSC